MKKAMKLIFKILLIPYLIIVIFLTVCLLNYNEYKITEFGNKTLIIVKDDSLKPTFKKGDLVIVTKNENKEIAKGDQIFFYETTSNRATVNLGSVVDKNNITATETTFIMPGDYALSSAYVIGKADTSKTISKVGSTLGVMESKYGFLLIVVLPILVAFLYEIYAIFKEVATDVKANKQIKKARG
jgi:signal peptidase I